MGYALLVVALFVLGLARALVQWIACVILRVPVEALQIGYGKKLASVGRVELHAIPIWPWLRMGEGKRVPRSIALGLGVFTLYALPVAIACTIACTVPSVPTGPVMVGSVVRGSAAELAGIHAGDHILRVDDIEIDDGWRLVDAISARAGQRTHLEIERDGRRIQIEAFPSSSQGGRGLLGVRLRREMTTPPFRTAALASLTAPFELTLYAIESVAGLLTTTHDRDPISGPVGASSMSSDSPIVAYYALIAFSIGAVAALVLQLIPTRGFTLGDLLAR